MLTFHKSALKILDYDWYDFVIQMAVLFV